MIPFEASFPRTAAEGRVLNYWGCAVCSGGQRDSELDAARLRGLGLRRRPLLPRRNRNCDGEIQAGAGLWWRFLEEATEAEKSGRGLGTHILYENFKKWCEKNGERYGSSREFTEKIKAKGFPVEKRHGGGYFFLGLQMAEGWRAPEEEGGY